MPTLPGLLVPETPTLDELLGVTEEVGAKRPGTHGDTPTSTTEEVIFPEDSVASSGSFQAPKRIKKRRAPNPEKYPRPIRDRNGKLVRDKNGKVLQLDYAGAVYKFLCTVGTDQLNYSFHVLGNPLKPTHDEFSAFLLDVLDERVRIVHDYDGMPWGSLTFAQAEKQASDAAAFVLQEWTPDFFTVAAHRGRLGGLKHKPRGKEFPLEWIAALDGLTAAQAAKELGCDKRTIQRGRAQLREQV